MWNYIGLHIYASEIVFQPDIFQSSEVFCAVCISAAFIGLRVLLSEKI